MLQVLLGVLVLLWPGEAVLAQEADTRAQTCIEMATAESEDIRDAPSMIAFANRAKFAGTPACIVRGYSAPQISFSLIMPDSWNGDLLVVGIGGAAGAVVETVCEPYVSQGFACITSDFGHSGTGLDGLWALDNPLAQADLSHRATHVLLLAGKHLAQTFYERAVSRSYFAGCSGGGTLGLTAAQRFPLDFDGIVVGDPAILVSEWAMHIAWANKVLRDPAGLPLFDDASLAVLNRGAIDHCDEKDGLRDGVISDPIGCDFRPEVLTCSASKTSQCLTPAQTRAATSIYQGPPMAGGRTSLGSLAWTGSEKEWIKFYAMKVYVESQFRYGVFGQSRGELTGDPSADLARFGTGVFRDASNPDLRRFAAAGGKIIMYIGAANGVGVSGTALDYFRTAERTSGGPEATRDFFQLYLVPGMNHCEGGVGAWRADFLTALTEWVESGTAPQQVVATHEPLQSETARQFARPLYPYPQFASYVGGDPSEYTSFKPSQGIEEPLTNSD